VLNTRQCIRRLRLGKKAMLYHSGVARKAREDMVKGFQRTIDPTGINETKLAASQYDRDIITAIFEVMG